MARPKVLNEVNMSEWAIAPYVFYTEVTQTRVVAKSDPKAHWRFPSGERMHPNAEKALKEFEQNGRRFLPDPNPTHEEENEIPGIKQIERPEKNKMVLPGENKQIKMGDVK